MEFKLICKLSRKRGGGREREEREREKRQREREREREGEDLGIVLKSREVCFGQSSSVCIYIYIHTRICIKTFDNFSAYRFVKNFNLSLVLAK